MRIPRLRRQKADELAPEAQTWLAQRLSDAGGSSDRTATFTQENRNVAYSGHSWTWVAVHKICQKGSRCPFVLKRGDTLIEKHPLLDLLRRPNPMQSSVRLLSTTMMSMELWGNAYWVIERNGKKPAELWGVLPTRVEIAEKINGVPELYSIRGNGGERHQYDASDVVWFHYDGPASHLDSVCPTSAAERAVKTDMLALRAQFDFFDRGANPPFALTTDENLQDGDVQRLRAQWEASYSGVTRWWKPLLLWGGMKPTPLSAPPSTTWIQLRNQLRQEILAVFDVPPAIAGVFDNANYGVSIREQRAMFWEDCLQPRLDGIDSDISHQLASQYDDGLTIGRDYSGIAALQPDWAGLAQAASAFTASGVMTPDEFREEVLRLSPRTEAGGA